ncbi:MAG: ATP-binding cassette domain-containing protein [Oscillospiraceae bacterium]|nr:ATP-binding cassette domain-containing protein [Oscillospiraceae bacterium]
MSLYVDIEKNLGSFCLKAKFEAGDETISLLGASGCGKSLTLRCIAGIETPDKGRIVVDGITLFDSEKKINLTPQERRTGLMFQNYALFPNMTVLQNIRAGARREKDRQKRENMVQSVMENFGLTEFASRCPHQLSGGQQQRVALARILVSSPRILLLDEPFSALDSHLRFMLEREVRHVIRRFGKTVVLVSHDRDEVFRMSDSIAIMDGGRIEAIGPRGDVFRDPQTRRGAILTGCKNVSAIERLENGQILAVDWGIRLNVPNLKDDTTAVGVRMKTISPGPGENGCRCRVVEEIENPFSYTIMLEPLNTQCTVPMGWELLKKDWKVLRGEEMEIHIPAEAILQLRDQ